MYQRVRNHVRAAVSACRAAMPHPAPSMSYTRSATFCVMDRHLETLPRFRRNDVAGKHDPARGRLLGGMVLVSRGDHTMSGEEPSPVAREALDNALKHAGTRCVSVVLTRSPCPADMPEIIAGVLLNLTGREMDALFRR
jgi:hypothetical protein